MFGEGAVIPEKKLVDGRPSTVSQWWGYILQVWKSGSSLTVPEDKIAKVTRLAFDPVWDWGN